MLKDEIIEYCLKKNEAYIDHPLGDIPANVLAYGNPAKIIKKIK